MDAFYKRHRDGFPTTRADRVVHEPDEQPEPGPAVGDIVSVEGGAAANQSYTLYTMSEGEDEDEDGGAGCADPAAAAAEPADAAAPDAGSA